MKIAYFVSNRSLFPGSKSEITASSTVVSNIIKHLSKKHEITLYAAKGTPPIPNVRIIDLNIPPFALDSNISNSDWTTKAVLGMKQLYLGELFSHAADYDLIHLHTEPSYLGMSYVQLIDTPVLFTSHNEYHDAESQLFSFYEKRVYFSGLSHSQVSRIPFSKPPTVIHNGIEVEMFPFEKVGDDYYLFLGRLHADKGIDTFLQLAKSLPDKKFVIVGKGDKNIEKSIKDLEQNVKNVTFMGMVPRATDKWFSLLSKAKALISPVNYEDTCPLVPLEAMACGTPVIAFPKGALPEQVIDGETGFITSQSSLTSLLEGVNKLSSLSHEEYMKLRSNSRKHIEAHFTTEIMAKKYDDLYNAIVSHYKKEHLL